MGNARSLVALCVCGLLLPACSPSSDGPLSLGGYGNTLVPQGAAPYFVVDACLEHDPQAVTLTDVEAVQVSGTDEPISFRVAWADGPEFSRVISSHEPLPDAYVPAEGARGEVGVQVSHS